MKVLLVLVAFAAVTPSALRHAASDARVQSLGPWYISTVMPDGQPGGFGAWKTRELCEAQIAQTEKRNNSYGSQCLKNPLVYGYADKSKFR